MQKFYLAEVVVVVVEVEVVVGEEAVAVVRMLVVEANMFEVVVVAAVEV